jgi:hypothetical protein
VRIRIGGADSMRLLSTPDRVFMKLMSDALLTLPTEARSCCGGIHEDQAWAAAAVD